MTEEIKQVEETTTEEVAAETVVEAEEMQNTFLQKDNAAERKEQKLRK